MKFPYKCIKKPLITLNFETQKCMIINWMLLPLLKARERKLRHLRVTKNKHNHCMLFTINIALILTHVISGPFGCKQG